MYTHQLPVPNVNIRRYTWKVFFAGFLVGISSLILAFILLFNLITARSYQSYPPTEVLIAPTQVEDGVHTI